MYYSRLGSGTGTWVVLSSGARVGLGDRGLGVSVEPIGGFKVVASET